MKIRSGFVSNSSSSSFIISKKKLSEEQIQKIHDHLTWDGWTHLSQLSIDASGNAWDGWNIREDEESVFGSTGMDNFPMDAFLESIGVKDEDVKFSKDGG